MSLTILSPGTFALIGSTVDEIAQQALSSLKLTNPNSSAPYHIVLLSELELQRLSKKQSASLPASVNTDHVFAAGVGSSSCGAVFVVIIWAAGQQLRSQLNLPPRQFYIALPDQNGRIVHHDARVDTSVNSLLPGQFPETPNPDFLDHLAFTLHLSKDYDRAQPFCVDLISLLPDSPRGFLRLADSAFSTKQHKLSMLSYACAFQRSSDPKVQNYSLKKMAECSKGTEWGTVFMESEISQVPAVITALLLAPWSAELRAMVSEMKTIPTLCLESREHLFVPTHPAVSTSNNAFLKLPRFFRWLIPFHFAAMSTPKDEADIVTLASPHLGIRHVLTLTEETPLPKAWFPGRMITNTYLPVPNFQPPSIEQMDIVMRLVGDEDRLPLLVHCGGGKGRAGTVAACYIATYGFGKPHEAPTHPAMSSDEAVAILRSIRPGSIETTQQQSFVSRWCSVIWKRQSVLPDGPSEPPPCAPEIEGRLDQDCDFLMLVGLPGSGKSWFSNALTSRNHLWTHISQDESGSRSLCESAIGQARGPVLLDRCNTNASDRKLWLDLASIRTSSPVCVWFDYDQELCAFRAQCRASHPTLQPGSRVRNAIEQMRRTFVRPTLGEGFKAIVIVRSFAAAQELILRLSPPITLFKFPRTPHFLDLGAVTSDDVRADLPAMPHSGHVVITEKVDGANMGFSLSADRQVVVQNRSHTVNSATHEQFKKLGHWVEQHHADLLTVLDRDEHFAERYILFGEWLFATHSIPYTRLPDRFMAFDLYDRSTGVWASRKLLAAILASTNISLVPVLHEGGMPSIGALREMVQLSSQYYDGRIEGIYVKVEQDGKVVCRGKVVRGDFIAGNDHWTKGKLQVNGLASNSSG